MTDHERFPAQPELESEAELIGAISASIDSIILRDGRDDPLFGFSAPINLPTSDRIFTEGPLRSSVRLAAVSKHDLPQLSHKVNYIFGGGSGAMLLVDSSPDDPHGTVIIPSDDVRRRATPAELQEVSNDLMLTLGTQAEPSAEPTQTSPAIGPEPEQKERYWSLEQSAAAVEGLMGMDLELALAVNDLAGGSIGVVRAIKERLADEISYDPGEALTPDRIRAIVKAPTDQTLLDSWRSDFYAPYREKYRAQ
jgi:hypothetical protein